MAMLRHKKKDDKKSNPIAAKNSLPSAIPGGPAMSEAEEAAMLADIAALPVPSAPWLSQQQEEGQEAVQEEGKASVAAHAGAAATPSVNVAPLAPAAAVASSSSSSSSSSAASVVAAASSSLKSSSSSSSAKAAVDRSSVHRQQQVAVSVAPAKAQEKSPGVTAQAGQKMTEIDMKKQFDIAKRLYDPADKKTANAVDKQRALMMWHRLAEEGHHASQQQLVTIGDAKSSLAISQELYRAEIIKQRVSALPKKTAIAELQKEILQWTSRYKQGDVMQGFLSVLEELRSLDSDIPHQMIYGGIRNILLLKQNPNLPAKVLSQAGLLVIEPLSVHDSTYYEHAKLANFFDIKLRAYCRLNKGVLPDNPFIFLQNFAAKFTDPIHRYGHSGIDWLVKEGLRQIGFQQDAALKLSPLGSGAGPVGSKSESSHATSSSTTVADDVTPRPAPSAPSSSSSSSSKASPGHSRLFERSAAAQAASSPVKDKLVQEIEKLVGEKKYSTALAQCAGILLGKQQHSHAVIENILTVLTNIRRLGVGAGQEGVVDNIRKAYMEKLIQSGKLKRPSPNKQS